MQTQEMPLLLVGEVMVDFTLPQHGQEPKLRLGGITHAARGLWAAGIKYSAAVICPEYLVKQAQEYFLAHGCTEFILAGSILGAPNVIAIADPKEISHQGYEDILREERIINLLESKKQLEKYSDILIFPGHFNIGELKKNFSRKAVFSFDIAYNISDLNQLDAYKSNIRALIISTSSPLFLASAKENIDSFITSIKSLSIDLLLLKENRGGSRLFDIKSGNVEEIPADLSKTVNSVGVGDVYSAVFTGLYKTDPKGAAWRGARAATFYSQTTYPDDFRTNIQREQKVSLDILRSLGGTFLPWHERPQYPIYLAGPDFSYIEKQELTLAVNSLEYHNFLLRRPIIENGEVAPGSPLGALKETYNKDLDLLNKCELVFAIPLNKDPGTLVEIGIALQQGKPVITYDPREENKNTMVMAGSDTYSTDLDECLNGVFKTLSKRRKK